MRRHADRGANKGRSATDGSAEGRQATRQDWKPVGEDCDGLSKDTVKDLNDYAKGFGFNESYPNCGNLFEQAGWFRQLDLYEEAAKMQFMIEFFKIVTDVQRDFGLVGE